MEPISASERTGDQVTVWITRTVKPGFKDAFESALHDFVSHSLPQPGQLGVHITRPPLGGQSRDYVIVRKFASRDALKAYHASPEYNAWLARTRDFTEGEPRIQELSGLESWFTPSDAPLRPLPQWKMALVTFIGVYPLTSILPPLFTHVLYPPFHPLLVNVLTTGVIVALLTWAIMPLLTRVFKKWLHN